MGVCLLSDDRELEGGNSNSPQLIRAKEELSILSTDSMSNQGASMSSPFSSSTPRWNYDVFLNFRGMDIHGDFIDHLYVALQREGIMTFKDNEELDKGKSVSPECLKAIEESRLAIVIISRNYAFSTWCLDVLAKIIKRISEAQFLVLPIYYDVDQSYVRKQMGTFEQAFIEHEKCFKENIEMVKMWRVALRDVSNLAGWHLQDRHGVEFVQQIVEVIKKRLSYKSPSFTRNIVGIEYTMERLIPSYLSFENNTCMIGIYGMGGLGKTTLARAIYDEFDGHFEGSSFIANVREKSQKGDLHLLQQELLRDILGEQNTYIMNVNDGANRIKNWLRYKKVLLVIDDVDHVNQLEKLAGGLDWFGLGSWIIITTRDEGVLVRHGVYKRYIPEVLNNDDASKLFCLKAFKMEQPKEGYMHLSRKVVEYANGLPLALVTLGAFLFGRTIPEWKSALDGFKNTKGRVFEILKISYDELEEMWKEIFLDIACFFRHWKKDRVIQILENCGFDASIGIAVLVEKSLLTIDDSEFLGMHDLIAEMGQKIIRFESRGQLGKQSRLWDMKDLLHVLQNDMATEAIQAIVLNLFEGDEVYRHIEVCSEVFSKMCNLRLLIIDNVHILDDLNNLSNKLRLLEWRGYSSKCLPSTFQSVELVELKLWFSKIEYLWRGVKFFDSLKLIDLEHSTNLIRTPDFTGVLRLEKLCLGGCINLVEIHPSIGYLSWLTVLNLKFCRSLTNLPSSMDGLRSLEILILLGCSKLANLPEKLGEIKCLKELDLTGAAIQEVPSSISFLICRGCEKQLFKSRLDSVLCVRLLKYLALSSNNLVFTLPASISQLLKLEALNLGNCIQLHSVPNLPSNVRYINAKGCSSLEPSPELLSMSNLLQPSISFFNYCKLVEYNQGSDGHLQC